MIYWLIGHIYIFTLNEVNCSSSLKNILIKSITSFVSCDVTKEWSLTSHMILELHSTFCKVCLVCQILCEDVLTSSVNQGKCHPASTQTGLACYIFIGILLTRLLIGIASKIWQRRKNKVGCSTVELLAVTHRTLKY